MSEVVLSSKQLADAAALYVRLVLGVDMNWHDTQLVYNTEEGFSAIVKPSIKDKS